MRASPGQEACTAPLELLEEDVLEELEELVELEELLELEELVELEELLELDELLDEDGVTSPPHPIRSMQLARLVPRSFNNWLCLFMLLRLFFEIGRLNLPKNSVCT